MFYDHRNAGHCVAIKITGRSRWRQLNIALYIQLEVEHTKGELEKAHWVP